MKPFYLILFLPTIALAQLKGNNTISIGPEYLIKSSDMAYGVHVSGNAIVSKGSSMGVEIGYVKFPGLNSAYVPVSLKITSILNDDKTKSCPMLMIQPGYGLYHDRGTKPQAEAMQKGGPTLYVGLGLAFPTKNSSRGFVMVGYSNYGFEANNVRTRSGSVGIRGGIMLN